MHNPFGLRLNNGCCSLVSIVSMNPSVDSHSSLLNGDKVSWYGLYRFMLYFCSVRCWFHHHPPENTVGKSLFQLGLEPDILVCHWSRDRHIQGICRRSSFPSLYPTYSIRTIWQMSKSATTFWARQIFTIIIMGPAIWTVTVAVA